jgi:hypothetical protein
MRAHERADAVLHARSISGHRELQLVYAPVQG